MCGEGEPWSCRAGVRGGLGWPHHRALRTLETADFHCRWSEKPPGVSNQQMMQWIHIWGCTLAASWSKGVGGQWGHRGVVGGAPAI